MPLAIPPELKKIAPYVKRAEELDKDKTSPESRLVAYYCRQYAVHVGIPLAGNTPGAKTCLGHLLSELEKEKPAMDNFTRDEAAFLCRKFAEGIFNKADEQDRSGNANKATAKTFYAAANFLQILEQFAEEDDESTEEDKKRIVYAKWKATEILKALKEGRQPTPGGYGEEEEKEDAEEASERKDNEEEDSESKEREEQHDDTTPAVETVEENDDHDATFGLPPPPTTLKPPTSMMTGVVPPPPPLPESEDEDEMGTEVALGPPPAYPADDNNDSKPTSSTARVDRPTLSFDLPISPPPTLPTVEQSPKKQTGLFGFGKKKKGTTITKAAMADALELTRFAMAALEDKDTDLAAERLQQALSALGR